MEEVVNFKWPQKLIEYEQYSYNLWYFAQVCFNINKAHDSLAALEELINSLVYLVRHCLWDDVTLPCELSWPAFNDWPIVSADNYSAMF